MHTWERRWLAVALSLSLWPAPVLSTSKLLGMVVVADRARMNHSSVSAGTNVFVGDAVTTDAEGVLQMQLRSTRVFLPGATRVSLSEDQERVVATLHEGTLGFASSGQETFLVSAAGVWIRPRTTATSAGEIKLLSDREFQITSGAGPLEVLLDGEVTVIPENRSARITVPQEPQGAGSKKKDRRRLAVIFLTAGAVAALVTCAVLFNTGGSTGGRAPVSPFVVNAGRNGHCQ